MLITELSYLKLTQDNKPRFTTVPASHILSSLPSVHSSNSGYEPAYIINLSPSFSIIYNSKKYYPTQNILGYHGPATLDIFTGTNLEGAPFLRLNALTITSPSLLDFDLALIDYTAWEREQEAARELVFGAYL